MRACEIARRRAGWHKIRGIYGATAPGNLAWPSPGVVPVRSSGGTPQLRQGEALQTPVWQPGSLGFRLMCR